MRTVKRAIRTGVAWSFMAPAFALLFCIGVAYDFLEAVGERLARAIDAAWEWSVRRG